MRVVAEAGQCHNGSVEKAIQMCWLAAHAGAWAIKFQHLTPETIARPDAPKYWQDAIGTDNQREAFARAGVIPYNGWDEIASAARDLGLEFMSTPFDLAAVDALEELDVNYYKLASGDLTFKQLLERVGATGKPVFLSTGASDYSEIRRALGWLWNSDPGPSSVTLLACTLSYPTLAVDAHLARIEALRGAFGIAVGYSDHTSLPETALGAAALGAQVLEVHYTLDKNAPDVPDHAMAVDPPTLAKYVTAAELGEKLRGSPLLQPCPAEEAARNGARRSICAARDLSADHVVEERDLAFLRPGDGLPPFATSTVVGHRLGVAVKAGDRVG